MKKPDAEWEIIVNEVRELYEEHPTGCCLHIALDDGNIDEDDILWCVNYAKDQGHPKCYILANRLLFLTLEERKLLYKW